MKICYWIWISLLYFSITPVVENASHHIRNTDKWKQRFVTGENVVKYLPEDIRTFFRNPNLYPEFRLTEMETIVISQLSFFNRKIRDIANKYATTEIQKKLNKLLENSKKAGNPDLEIYKLDPIEFKSSSGESLYLMLKDLKFSGLEKYSGSYFQDGFEETVMPGERRKDVSWNIKIQGKLMEDPVLISCKFAISNKSGDEVQENTELNIRMEKISFTLEIILKHIDEDKGMRLNDYLNRAPELHIEYDVETIQITAKKLPSKANPTLYAEHFSVLEKMVQQKKDDLENRLCANILTKISLKSLRMGSKRQLDSMLIDVVKYTPEFQYGFVAYEIESTAKKYFWMLKFLPFFDAIVNRPLGQNWPECAVVGEKVVFKNGETLSIVDNKVVISKGKTKEPLFSRSAEKPKEDDDGITPIDEQLTEILIERRRPSLQTLLNLPEEKQSSKCKLIYS